MLKRLYYQEQLLALHGLYPLGCSQKAPECKISDIKFVALNIISNHNISFTV